MFGSDLSFPQVDGRGDGIDLSVLQGSDRPETLTALQRMARPEFVSHASENGTTVEDTHDFGPQVLAHLNRCGLAGPRFFFVDAIARCIVNSSAADCPRFAHRA